MPSYVPKTISRKMVRVWFMDDEATDQRLEHHRTPEEYCSLEDLFKRTGVEYYHFPIETYQQDGALEELKKKRGYSYEDEISISKDTLPDYENKIKNFFTEHLHTDEEIRFVLEGSGYFDVRDADENWLRVEMVPGDMIILPSGIYHRFTLDMKNYIKAKRFFVGEPVWLPYNRPVDDMECRKDYVRKLKDSEFESLH